MPAVPPPPYLVTILYRSERSLGGFLDSLLAQTKRDWRLLAVDNASSDGSVARLRDRGDARIELVANGANLGFAKAANQGLRAAVRQGAERIVLINNDTVFAPDFLDRFTRIWSELDAGIVVPRIMKLSDPRESWYAPGRLDRDWVFRGIHEHDDPHETRNSWVVDYATGCCLGLTRDALGRVGLFDESFFVYFEDLDFCLRAAASGVPVHYVREPSILHEGGGSSGGEFSPAYDRNYYKSYMQLLRKHFGRGYALRSAARLLKEVAERQARGRRRLPGIVAAMARGMIASSVEPSRL